MSAQCQKTGDLHVTPDELALSLDLPKRAVALVLAIVIKTFFVQAFYIPSGSMESTLHGCPTCPNGDRVLVNKLTSTVTATPAPTPNTPADTGSISNHKPEPESPRTLRIIGALMPM